MWYPNFILTKNTPLLAVQYKQSNMNEGSRDPRDESTGVSHVLSGQVSYLARYHVCGVL